MGAERLVDETGAGRRPDEHPDGSLTVIPDVVEVRRHSGVAALVGGAGSVLAIAYLARATQTGALLDWLLALLMGGVGAAWLAALLDARTPLLVADAQGVRLRLGRSWQGLPWTSVARVEHLPRRGLLRDGRLVVVPHDPGLVQSGLTGAARRQALLARLLHGAPLAVPLGLSTRVVAAGDLSTSLRQVCRTPEQVVDVASVEVEDEPAAAETAVPVVEDEPARDQEVRASATPAPLRESVSGRRAEVHHVVEPVADDEPAGRELRRAGAVSLVEETEAWGDRVRPIATAGEPVAELVIDDFAIQPADDPVIGPEIAAARTRLGLSVEQLAERTRIRPHVLESIEVDDFEPCGGDFYARGHLRTLARVLGIDAAGVLASYDERYARAPINARRVFEAELATGAHGSIRGTRGGPNWSVLVAAVMALVLFWSVARLVMDTPSDLQRDALVLNGSGGPQGAGSAPAADPVPVVVSAPAGGARVVVRDGNGEIVFAGPLAVGQSRELAVSPPVRVQSS
ncbi:MAG: helix-turn-helix domain-containing protein, partial [Nocardioides sp.]|nr:helix-turn-helix domain-containing protein [Nocardioides sp.]